MRDVVEANRPQVNDCWNKAVVARPGLTGKIFVEWTIGAEGTVASADISSSSIPSSLLSECLLEAIRGWVFEPPPDRQPAKIMYPFRFLAE